MHLYRSHTCGQIREGHAGQEVRLSGWCHRIRDHGGLLFLDLRDHYGLVQCVVDPQSPAFLEAEKLRSEWVVRINGKVQLRPEGTENKHLPSGSIEILVTDLEVLGESLELPLPIFGEQDYPEETRLKYRFLDLRRERLHRNIMLRTKVIDSLRHHMKGRGFFEFQTPILTASSPEGARDFLVPSRLHAGKFYALPQAPQQYKQLIMMAGFDRYFQIAPCFRDEDPRADRLPGEFYQLDVEMSFVTQEEIFATIEPVIRAIFEEFGQGKKVTQNFPWISYADSLSKYGSDKPDLRNPIELCDVSEFFRGADFKLFARLLEEKENQIWAIPAKGGGSRTFCDRMNEWAKGEQQPGLGYMFWKENKSMGPIAQNIGGGRAEALQRALHLGEGDAAFFVAGKPEKFMKFIGLARNKIGQELHLTAEDGYYFAWIVDFPLYEWNEEEKRVDFSHNPFSMPQATLTELQSQDPLAIKAFQYDLTCNGYELASGAIRNHRPEIMRQVFALAGYPEPLLEARFGALYRAFHYGAPPHGGLAAGIDRIVMLLAGEQNLREVTLFPMNQQAEDILMGAPSEVLPKQLKELQMQILKER